MGKYLTPRQRARKYRVFLGKLPRGGKVLGFQGGQSTNARSTLSRGVWGHALPENF